MFADRHLKFLALTLRVGKEAFTDLGREVSGVGRATSACRSGTKQSGVLDFSVEGCEPWLDARRRAWLTLA
jgi:hypothetical protein